jgi:glycosyltransferase involved in cell wall biosynthesis
MAQIVSSHCQLPVERFQVIPNALDTELFIPVKANNKKEWLTILFVGRLERAKGVEVLGQAIPQICQEVPAVRFVFVGADRPRPQGGSHRRYLEQVLSKYIEAGQIEFRGEVSQSELIQVYQQADISVVPSLLYESFSYTCVQAMACGLPVVASCIGGIPETLDQGKCGILVTPGNIQELAAALVSLCRDIDKRHVLGAAARERAITTFSAKVVAKRNLEVFTQALYA